MSPGRANGRTTETKKTLIVKMIAVSVSVSYVESAVVEQESVRYRNHNCHAVIGGGYGVAWGVIPPPYLRRFCVSGEGEI